MEQQRGDLVSTSPWLAALRRLSTPVRSRRTSARPIHFSSCTLSPVLADGRLCLAGNGGVRGGFSRETRRFARSCFCQNELRRGNGRRGVAQHLRLSVSTTSPVASQVLALPHGASRAGRVFRRGLAREGPSCSRPPVLRRRRSGGLEGNQSGIQGRAKKQEKENKRKSAPALSFFQKTRKKKNKRPLRVDPCGHALAAVCLFSSASSPVSLNLTLALCLLPRSPLGRCRTSSAWWWATARSARRAC